MDEDYNIDQKILFFTTQNMIYQWNTNHSFFRKKKKKVWFDN